MLKISALKGWMSVYRIQRWSNCKEEWLRNDKYLIKRWHVDVWGINKSCRIINKKEENRSTKMLEAIPSAVAFS